MRFAQAGRTLYINPLFLAGFQGRAPTLPRIPHPAPPRPCPRIAPSPRRCPAPSQPCPASLPRSLRGPARIAPSPGPARPRPHGSEPRSQAAAATRDAALRPADPERRRTWRLARELTSDVLGAHPRCRPPGEAEIAKERMWSSRPHWRPGRGQRSLALPPLSRPRSRPRRRLGAREAVLPQGKNK
ncbi:uncharacterized protein GJ701_000467 [Geothlypis trichas]